MTVHPPRLFASDDAIAHVGEGLLARTLPKAEWTHEAHLAATTWILRSRPEILPERDMAGIIAPYNAAVGGVNDDHNGYHETITQCFVRAVRLHLESEPSDAPLADAVNRLLLSSHGARDWPLRFFSADRLFSVAARRGWVEPDIAPLPALAAAQRGC